MPKWQKGKHATFSYSNGLTEKRTLLFTMAVKLIKLIAGRESLKFKYTLRYFQMHPHNCWVEWLTTGCNRFISIGYLCWFGFCIAWDVSNNINPHKRSKNGFKIEAIIDNDLLSIEAKTINAKSTMLAMFVTRIAILSRLSFISSAWQSVNKLTKTKKLFLFSGKRDRFYLKIDFFFLLFFSHPPKNY